MKNIITLIFISLFFQSCCINNNKELNDNKKVIEKWHTSSCIYDNFHANICIHISDTADNLKYRLCPHFGINLNNTDSTFVIYDQFGQIKKGDFIMNDSCLSLTLNNENYKWIDFNIDSLNENHIFLSRGQILLYNRFEDSVEFFTSDLAEISLARVNE